MIDFTKVKRKGHLLRKKRFFKVGEVFIKDNKSRETITAIHDKGVEIVRDWGSK